MDDLRLQQWYYYCNDEQCGPVSTDDLADLYVDAVDDTTSSSSVVNKNTLVQPVGSNTTERKPILEYSELYQYLNIIDDTAEERSVAADEQQQQTATEPSDEEQQQHQQQQQQTDTLDQTMEYVEQLQTYVNKDKTLMYNYTSAQWEPIPDDVKNMLIQQSAYDSYVPPAPIVPQQQTSDTIVNPKKRKSEEIGKNKKFNFSVYASNLPSNCTTKDIHNFFSKCGVIQTKSVSDVEVPMIKLYYSDDAQTQVNAALVTFFRPESVNLALTLLDDREFLGQRIKIEEAKFEDKGNKGGAKPAKRRKTTTKKSSNAKKIQWGFNDEKSTDDTIGDGKSYILILKHVFHPNDALQDPNFFTALKQTISLEISKLMAIDRVKIWKNSVAGVVEVRMKRVPVSKEALFHQIIEKWNGKRIGDRVVQASEGTGKERWEEVEDNEEQRHEKFGEVLDSGAL